MESKTKNELFNPETTGGFCRLLLKYTRMSNEDIAVQAVRKLGGGTNALSVNWYASQLRKLGVDVERNDQRLWS